MTLALITAALLSQSYYTPTEAQALFAQANDAFYGQPPDYQAAKTSYLKLIEHGMSGQDVLFNLGTTCLAAGEMGEAVLYLERARKLGRTDDIEANLSLARAKQADQVVGDDAAEPFLQRLADATDGSLFAVATLSTLWAGVLLVLLFRFLKPGSRTWAALLATVCLLAALGCGSIVAVHAWAEDAFTEAVVMKPSLQVRELPGGNGRVAFEVHAGLKVRVVEESGRFVRIRLPNNLEGWTESEGVARL